MGFPLRNRALKHGRIRINTTWSRSAFGAMLRQILNNNHDAEREHPGQQGKDRWLQTPPHDSSLHCDTRCECAQGPTRSQVSIRAQRQRQRESQVNSSQVKKSQGPGCLPVSPSACLPACLPTCT